MIRRRLAQLRVPIAIAVVALAAASCDELTELDGAATTAPTDLTVVSGDAQTGTVGAPLADSLTVSVADAEGAPVGGVEVGWATADTGGVFSPAVSTTDSTGVATTAWTLGTVAGDQSAEAAVETVGGVSLSASFSATANAAAAAEVAVTPGDISFTTVGDTATFTAETLDPYGNGIEVAGYDWSSADTAVATVDQTGLVTVTGQGSTEITASVDSVSGSGTVQVVLEAAELTVSDVSADTLNAVGDTVLITATVRDAGGTEIPDVSVTWENVDTAVARIDSSDGETATVTSAGAGEIVIVAALDELSDTARVVSRQVPATVAVDLSRDTIANGSDLELAAVISDSNAVEIPDPEVIWSVSDTLIAEIDTAATLTGRGVGLLSVTAQSGSASANAPLRVTPRPADAVANGPSGACVLDAEGQAYCWGQNFNGELGNGSSGPDAHRNEAQAVTGGHTFKEIAGTFSGYCALDNSGEAYCWGGNYAGGLGIGTADGDPHSTPEPVAGGHAFTALDGSWYAFCAVDDAGDAYCWGWNDQGQVDGTGSGPDACAVNWATNCAASPTKVPGGHTFTEVATGGRNHSCGVTDDGSTLCWGTNFEGQFGNGATATTPAGPEAAAGGMTFVSLTADWSHTCGIDEDGSAWCWGQNGAGRLGDGTQDAQLDPVPVAGGHAWRQLNAGNGWTCGVTDGNAAYCWGVGYDGRLGGGTWLDQSTPNPVGSQPMTAIGAQGVSCGLGTDGNAYCWGSSDYGGLGNQHYPLETVPVDVSGGHTFTDMSARGLHTCAVDDTGAAWCWGANWWGNLGDGTQEHSTTPVQVASTETFASIATAADFTCALNTDGAAYCWGWNSYGELGDGSTVEYSADPVAVTGGHTFERVEIGGRHACAVDTAGTGYCWGAGQALGTTNVEGDSHEPVEVDGGHTWARIGAAAEHTCGLTTGGEIYCWGSNSEGQLGTTAVTDHSTTPVLVDGGHTWADLSVGDGWHTCALDDAGDIYCWGRNDAGQLGDGTQNEAGTPVQVAGSHTWTSIYTASDHSCGITDTGDAYCWGHNLSGELGDGSNGGISTSPVAVSGGPFTQLSGSWDHTCGLSANGTLQCWGYMGHGQLGTGEMAFFNTPQQVVGGFTVSSLSADGAGAWVRSNDPASFGPSSTAITRPTIRAPTGSPTDPRSETILERH